MHLDSEKGPIIRTIVSRFLCILHGANRNLQSVDSAILKVSDPFTPLPLPASSHPPPPSSVHSSPFCRPSRPGSSQIMYRNCEAHLHK